tara:strand:- start:44 stop:238 length:195 start_codon:yes stop_codon:yes gene_type:complete
LGGINALAELPSTPASCYQIGAKKLTKLLRILSQCFIFLFNKSQFSLIYVQIICKEQSKKDDKK